MNETITVRGVGTVRTKPDYVSISLTLKGENVSYSAAVEEANQKILLLRQPLDQIGYKDGDLKTVNYSAHTVYEYNKANNRVFKGYICEYSLRLSFDFTPEALARTLTAIASSSANAEFSISFTVKEPEKISEELLVAATYNARQKAEILSGASGKTLGKLVSIDYNWLDVNVYSRSNYVIEEQCFTSKSAVPEFTPDDILSSDSVTFVWELA